MLAWEKEDPDILKVSSSKQYWIKKNILQFLLNEYIENAGNSLLILTCIPDRIRTAWAKMKRKQG